MSNHPISNFVRITAVAWTFGFCATVSAIVFPLTTEKYDHEKNRIKYPAANEKGHHIGHFLDRWGSGFLGVAVGPQWFLVAHHTINNNGVSADVRSIIYQDTPYTIVSSNQIGRTDLTLVKVAQTFPSYSRIAKAIAPDKQIGTVYGLGASTYADGFIKGSTGKVQGRAYTKGVSYGYNVLRWGRTKNGGYVGDGRFKSIFTPFDKDLGDDCAGLTVGDSGGTVFLREDGVDTDIVTGVCKEVQSLYRNINDQPKSTKNCKDMAHVWNGAGLHECGSTATIPFPTSALVTDVGLYSSNIYNVISPPVRINANDNGPAVAEWESWKGSEGKRYEARNISAAIDMSSAKPAAPESVYRGMVFSLGSDPIAYKADDLLRNEKYTVHLHFSGAVLSVNQNQMSANVNGVKKDTSPSRENKAYVVSFPDISPDALNRIVISVAPKQEAGINNRASLCGIEILLQR